MDIKVYKTLSPDTGYYEFPTEEDKMKFLKMMEIISPEANDIKPLFYNGLFSEGYCRCDVVGYIDDNTLIISLDNHLHCIATRYFIEMQPKIKESKKYINNIPVYTGQ